MEQLRVGGEYKDSTLMMIYLGVLPCIKEKNSVHDIFLGFRCVVEVFSVNVKSVLCLLYPWFLWHSRNSDVVIKFALLSPVKHGMSHHLNFLVLSTNWMFLRCFDWNLNYSSLFRDQRPIHIHTFGIMHTSDDGSQL